MSMWMGGNDKAQMSFDMAHTWATTSTEQKSRKRNQALNINW